MRILTFLTFIPSIVTFVLMYVLGTVAAMVFFVVTYLSMSFVRGYKKTLQLITRAIDEKGK